MAFDYEEYQSYTGLAKNLSRQKYGPLDVSQLFLSEADLKWYCSNGVDSSLSADADTTMWNNLTIYPYPGQVVALRDSEAKTVRILKLTEQLSAGEVVTVNGKPQFEYSDIGIAPVGDGKSISVDADGKISIIGALSAQDGQYPVISGETIVWVSPDTTTVEGLTQLVSEISADVSEISVDIYTGLSSQISSNTDLLKVLSGDGEGSINEKIRDGLSTIVSGAPEAFDTLKEIADWISNDNTSAVYLVNHVAQAEKDILALSGDLSDLTGDLSGISAGLIGDITYISSTISNDYATKAEVNAVSTLLSNEITALDGRIEKYEDVISVDNGIVQISALSVSTISGVNSDFIVSNVSAENVAIQSTSALTFTTEDTTLAEILSGLSADLNIQITTGTTNGTISVNNVEVPVAGLDTAAYTPSSDYVQLTAYNSQITVLTEAISALNDHQEEYESAISVKDDGIVEINSLSVANISSTNAEFTATSVYTDNLQIKDLSTVTIADRNNQTLEAILSALSAELSSAIITNDLTWQELP